jgi:hypothetical protein
MTQSVLASRHRKTGKSSVHPQTRLGLEFLEWAARFESSREVAPAGAGYVEILESLTTEEREAVAAMVAREGEQWLVRNWSWLRIQVLYIRSL